MDTVELCLVLAATFGAIAIHPMSSQPLKRNAEHMMASTDLFGGADTIIEAPRMESCVVSRIESLKCRGTLFQVGLGTSKISFPVGQIHGKGATLKRSFRCDPEDYKLAVDLLRLG